MSENFEDEVQRRIQLFRLAEELGNVTRACEIMGVNKGSYYNFKKLYDEYGVEGLKGDKAEGLIHLASEKDKDEIINRVIEYVIQNPLVGNHKTRDLLLAEGLTLSATAIQKLLNDRGLGTTLDRIYKLEKKAFREGYDLSESQSELLLKYDPCMKESGLQSNHPGERLVQCIVNIHTPTPEKPLFAHFVLDRYGCLAFLTFDRTESIDVAIRLLNDSVIPYYYTNRIGIEEISLEAEDEPDTESLSGYSKFVKNYGIAPFFIESTDEHADGFAQRFLKDLSKTFLSNPGVDLRLDEIENLNEKAQMWLDQYNSSPYNGYRNFGNSPYAVIKAFKAGKRLI